MSTTTHESSPDPSSGEVSRREFPRWKKVLLTAAVFLVVAGLGFKAYGLIVPQSGQRQGVAVDQKNLTGQLTNPLLPSGEGSQQPQTTSVGESGGTMADWSPVFMKGGLSFLVGFSVGYALRTFVRISAVVLGLVCLAVFGLQYTGAVHIDWTAVQGWFDSVALRVKDEFSGFQTFVAGSLPSVGMAGAGLFTGVKKH